MCSRLLCIFGLFSFLVASCVSRRSPASEDLEYERLAAFEVATSKNEKLLILGLRKIQGDLSQRAFVSVQDYDWVPSGLDTIDPKFVVNIKDDHVTEVRTFELGDWNNGRAFGGVARSRQSHRVRSLGQDPTKYAGLPPYLLNVDSPRVALLTTLALVITNEALTFTPLTPIGGLLKNVSNWTESRLRSEASYFKTVIQQSKNSGKGPLSQWLSDDEVDRVVASLTIRYHPTKKFGGLFVPKEERLDYSKKIQAIREDEASFHYAALVRAANEQGLWVLPMSPHFALLAYDPSSELPVDHWNDFLLDVDNPQRLSKALLTMAQEKRKLVPLGFYSTMQVGTPTKVLDFQYPQSASVERRVNHWVTINKDVFASFVPIPFFTFGVNIVESVVKLVVKKQGSAYYEDRMDSYGELMALVDMGLLQLPVEELILENVFIQMKAWGLSEEEVDAYRTDWDSLPQDEIVRRSQEVFGSMIRDESSQALLFDAPTVKRLQHTKEVHMKRLDNWIRRKVSKQANIGGKKLITQAKADRLPAQDGAPATIIFLTDGLRPDRFREASEKGIFPNMTEHFLNRGAEMKAYTGRSLTLPSWTTILSGYEPDEHGIRSNSPASRASKGSSETFLDPRKDLLLPRYAKQGRSFRRLQESGLTWLPRYFDKEEVLVNFMPLNDGTYPPVPALLAKLVTGFKDLWAGTFSGAEALDAVSYDTIAETIRETPGKHRLILIWHSSIDSHSHYSNHQLNWAYETLDKGVGKILEAAKADPVLKNARTFVISDHGHMGGFEKANSEFCGQDKEILIDNTGFNLTKYFAGDFVEARHWDFVVGASESPEPEYDLGYLKEFLIQPFDYTYRGKRNTQGPRSLLVDYSGDNLAQIYILERESKEVKRPLNFFELRNYKRNTEATAKDMIASILDFQIRNLEGRDQKLIQCIRKSSGSHPVQYLGLSLGEHASDSIRSQIPSQYLRTWIREPVLIQSREGQGLVLTSKSDTGEDWFQYFSVRYFDQKESGEVSFGLDRTGSGDPLHLLGTTVDFEKAAMGMTDRSWLTRNVAAGSVNPTAPFYFVRALTLSPRLEASPARVAEKPDFVLLANRGFAFHSAVAHQSDHGGIHKLETQVSLFVSGLGSQAWSGHATSQKPVFTRDLVPTVLDQHGRKDVMNTLQGRSFESELESLRQ